LTLEDLAERIDFSPQLISGVELAKAVVSKGFVAACDRVLAADGALLKLWPAVVCERAMERDERSAARQRSKGLDAPGYAEVQAIARAFGLERYAELLHPSEADDDVDPLNRRDLIGAGVGAALGMEASSAPATARNIDPELVEHWIQLLRVLSRHDAMCGPRELLGPVRQQIGMIAEHRQVARGDLHIQLLRVEAHWVDLAASLSNQIGNSLGRNAWTGHAFRLAREAEYGDMIAEALTRRSQWAAEELDAPRTIAWAEAALRVPGTSEQTRALAALKEVWPRPGQRCGLL